MKRCRYAMLRAATSCAFALVLAGLSFAESPDQNPTAQMPTESASWINSGPLTLESLEGKGVVLWFFEEQCPRCKAAWPGLAALAKKHENEPVVFVAINSGNVPAAIQAYVKQNKVDWPVIVDTSRQMEKAAGVKEICLQNICQARLITPGGSLIMARWDDLEGAVQLALQGAQWKIDPSGIPA
jgi:thiol-disulfide isomerase/thioredoxin